MSRESVRQRFQRFQKDQVEINNDPVVENIRLKKFMNELASCLLNVTQRSNHFIHTIALEL
jgi:hypothetical protein